MLHEMKLQPRYYDYILEGTKRIELRLLDKKRKQIKIGDTIEFFKMPNLDESFKVKVIGLLNYNSFKELLNDFNISILSDKSMSKDELIDVLEEFYTKEEQKENGVLGIRFELI